MKRIITFILLAVLALTMFVPATFAFASAGMNNFEQVNRRTYSKNLFKDVNENLWYGAANQGVIKTAYELGFIDGNGDGTCTPEQGIKLSEAVKIAAIIRSIYEDDGAAFSSGNPWYKSYVDYAVACGIIKQNDFSNFEASATRAQMAYIFANCLPKSEYPEIRNISSVPDVNANTPYVDSILLLYKAGILTGVDGSGSFRPNAGIKRAEAAAIFVRIAFPAERKSGNGFVVVIDPGHQQKSNLTQEPVGPGATETKMRDTGGTVGRFTGLMEYKLNLDVSLKLRTELENRGYTVIMTRTTNDVDLGNIERANVANDNNADVFIRVHANGDSNAATNGAMTICRTAKNPYPGMYRESRALAEAVLDCFTAATGAKRYSLWETDTMGGLNWAKVPSIIIEMGFMSNKNEDTLMATDAYQNKMVTGMANGIDKFLGR